MSEPRAGTYLRDLEERLAEGARLLPGRFREGQTAFLLGLQTPGGGCPGRDGVADFYYTSFALRSARMLGIDEPGFWSRAGVFIRESAPGPKDIVDAFCLVHGLRLVEAHAECDCVRQMNRGPIEAAFRLVAACPSGEGGFAFAPGSVGSLYHTFIAALCHELADEPFPDPERAAGFVRRCRCADGGYADSSAREGVAGGVNPTAAAIALLSTFGLLDEETREGAAGFLGSMQGEDGGFAAHAGAPVSDLMSTFTALVTLAQFDAARRVGLGAAGRFVRSLAAPAAGFRGSVPDAAADAEYTYYGLGTLALLALEAQRVSGSCCCGGDFRQV